MAMTIEQRNPSHTKSDYHDNEQSMERMVRSLKRLAFSQDVAIRNLMDCFDIPFAVAKERVQFYWG